MVKIIPITENGVETYYEVDAPLQEIERCFTSANDTQEFKEMLTEKGFSIVKFRHGIWLNFDNK